MTNTNTQNAYPLSWPTGWPRTAAPGPSRFASNHPGWGKQRTTLNRALDELDAELCRLGVASGCYTLSTNLQLRLDGWPRSGQSKPEDTGVALYFELKGEAVALACDKWDRVECNVWALARHIESLRGQDRWGVGTLERAFTGYMALPENSRFSSNGGHWQVLGIEPTTDEGAIRTAFKSKAKECHPDRAGGSVEKFDVLTRAFHMALPSKGGAQ